jgi:hypothetical protein
MGSSVIVCDEGALDRRAGLPVVPDAGVEREQALEDAGPQACGDAAAVVFEAELVLQCPDDGLDALAQPVREGARGCLVLAGRADQGQAQVRAGEECLGVFAGQAFVGDDGGAGGGPVGGLVFAVAVVRVPVQARAAGGGDRLAAWDGRGVHQP